jgi:hypothetical protein
MNDSFKTYKIVSTILMICMVLFFSCRKVKMKDEKEVLIGTWEIYAINGSGFSSSGLTLIISKSGLVDLIGGSENLNEEGRFVKMRKAEDPTFEAAIEPQILLFFKININRKKIGSNVEKLSSFHWLRYYNGGYDASGNFVPGEGIDLIPTSGTVTGTYRFLRK